MAVDADTGPGSPPETDKSKQFLRLFLRNERRLYGYILTLLPNRADADDVLQETSLALWDKFDPDSPPTEFLAWARKFAYHKVLDFHKKSQRAQARLSRAFLERVSGAAATHSESPERDDRRDALADCLERLNPRDRELLTRRFADGATTQSTSEQLGRSVEAIYKALAKLRQALFDCVERRLSGESSP
jgi:RNA polymerase sigma-70 factor (ECF subfamily)